MSSICCKSVCVLKICIISIFMALLQFDSFNSSLSRSCYLYLFLSPKWHVRLFLNASATFVSRKTFTLRPMPPSLTQLKPQVVPTVAPFPLHCMAEFQYQSLFEHQSQFQSESESESESMLNCSQVEFFLLQL